MSDVTESWTHRIRQCWHESVIAFVKVGKILIEAKAALPHGSFGKMIENELPFGVSTAQKLMAIASDSRISNPELIQHLPPHWGTLYELTKLDQEDFARGIAERTIRPDMDLKAFVLSRKSGLRDRREAELGAKIRSMPGNKRYGVIYAVPPWKWDGWTERGTVRSADDTYDQLSVDEIMAIDVPGIAADDCVLGLWTTVPMEAHAHDLMAHWGFTFKTEITWVKSRLSTGYWIRNQHEVFKIGTKGNPPAPAMGTQPTSIIDDRERESCERHSGKPIEAIETLEKMFPSLPKVELWPRSPLRPGWDAWGNEVESARLAG